MQDLEPLIAQLTAAMAEPGTDAPPPPETTLRERMFEIVVVAFGALYPRMPTSGQIYERITIGRITMGLDDGDAASLGRRTDDWMRLEGLTKQEEGKRAYFLPFATTAVLSTATSAGPLGDVCAKVLERYVADYPSQNLREATRALGAELLVRMNK
jgi:hypothetical protein